MAHSNLSSKNSIAKAFLFFFSHAWDFIESAIEPLQWRTERRYWLEPRTFWKNYLNADKLLGVRFGDFTRYGMADVDRNSPYHPDNDEKAFRLLLWAFEDIGLCEYVVVQSSYSEGIHIYFFFRGQYNTYDVACALRKAVTEAGFKVAPGVLELFPNTKPYGDNKITLYNGHRLPLQHGSFLLDDSFAPYSESVKELVRLMKLTAKGQDMKLFKKTLQTSRAWWSEYKKNRHHSASSNNSVMRWKKDVEDLIKEGWTGYGQTNEMLKEIGKYGRVFLGLSGEVLWRFMVETATHCPGYTRYCRHQHEIWSRCKAWARIIEPYWLPLFNYPERNGTYRQMLAKGKKMAGSITNAMRHEDARGRIQKAVAHIIETVGSLPSKVKHCIKQIREATKELFNIAVSEATLRRDENIIIWHPKYRITEDVRPKDNGHKPENPNTNSVQSKQRVDKQSRNGATQEDVICKTEEIKKQPENNKNGHHRESRQTPPLMKGNGDVPQASSQENMEEEKLFEILKDAPAVFFTGFNGQSTCGPVGIKNTNHLQVRIIESNTEVHLLYHSDPDYLHSSHPKLVYIKPVSADDWIGGMAVSIHLLHPQTYPDDS